MSEYRFFISAPSVFHLGVKEKVLVQIEDDCLNRPVTLYLEDENTGTLMSKKEATRCTQNGDIKIVELMVKKNVFMIKRHYSKDLDASFKLLIYTFTDKQREVDNFPTKQRFSSALP